MLRSIQGSGRKETAFGSSRRSSQAAGPPRPEAAAETLQEGGSQMQVGGPVQEAGTIHPREQLNALLALAAIVMITVVVALMVWVLPLVTSEAGAVDIIP